MTITSYDIALFAAAYPNDTASGGGRMTATVVQDGVENNVFPDIDAAARASGRVQMRKVFVAVTTTDTSTLMAAQAGFAAGSSDAGVDVVAFAFGDSDTLRPAALAVLQSEPFTWDFRNSYPPGLPFGVSNYSLVSGQPNKVQMLDGAPLPAVGALAGFGETLASYSFGSQVLPTLTTVVTAVSGTTISFAAAVPGGFAYLFHTPGVSTQRVSAATLTATSTSTTVRINRVSAQIVPAITPYPSAVAGLTNTGALKVYGGRVPIFRTGDSVVIRNGSTVEVATVSRVDYTGGLTFTAALANCYPAGSVVTALLSFGDLQAAVGPSFTQQTWTRSWSDAILGNPIGLAYDTIAGSITTTNIGAETERWAIVFTSATAFNLIGEHVGQIGTGSTAAVFSPLNPITSAPYFSIAAAGWGSGWAIGNVLRFNTIGARAPVWITRCVSPSAAGSVNAPSLEVRGSIDA